MCEKGNILQFCLTMLAVHIFICAVVVTPYIGYYPSTLMGSTYFLSSHDFHGICDLLESLLRTRIVCWQAWFSLWTKAVCDFCVFTVWMSCSRTKKLGCNLTSDLYVMWSKSWYPATKDPHFLCFQPQKLKARLSEVSLWIGNRW